jgi:hydrogenase 3 maturation protease
VRQHLRPGYVVLGVGNRMRGDDAVGPLVAEGLLERGFERAFDCGTAPENFVGPVSRLDPSDVLFVDAVDFASSPGEVRLMGGESLAPRTASTHAPGLGPLADLLSAEHRCACWVLAVQPETLRWGGDVSEAVARSIERIVASPVWAT